jgi:hypothetical protein
MNMRASPGRECPSCGYLLASVDSLGVCSECGLPCGPKVVTYKRTYKWIALWTVPGVVFGMGGLLSGVAGAAAGRVTLMLLTALLWIGHAWWLHESVCRLITVTDNGIHLRWSCEKSQDIPFGKIAKVDMSRITGDVTFRDLAGKEIGVVSHHFFRRSQDARGFVLTVQTRCSLPVDPG